LKAEVILGRIFLVIIASMSGFFLLDYLSTWFISSRSPVERRFPVQNARQPQPYTMFGGRPNTGDFNALGYLGKAPVVPKETDEFRVLMLGGSTVLRGNPPIAELLEAECARNGATHVKVYNLGVVSSVSSMELMRIVIELSDLQADLIIFYNGGNDILHPWTWDPRPGFPFNFVVYESNPLLESDVNEYPAIAMLVYGSNIARRLFPNYFVNKFIQLEDLRKKVKWKTENWKEEIANRYVINLIKADKISRVFGAKFITFFQPLVFSKAKLDDPEKSIVSKDEDKKQYALDIQTRIKTKLNELKNRSSTVIIDLSHIFDNTAEGIFWDAIHTHQSAKVVIAKSMYKELINNNLINQ
jgi:hypothetical protein